MSLTGMCWPFLQENTTLRTLRLANNAWNHEIMHYFLQGLIANDTLTHLDIHSNRLGLEVCVANRCCFVKKIARCVPFDFSCAKFPRLLGG